MKILLLGKDGQVGRALQPALAGLGELIACGRAEADLGQPGELPRLIAAQSPDVIVNAAAYTAVDKAEADADQARLINAEAVATLAAAAHRLGAWLIHYSTDYVFDGEKPGAYLETDEARPLSVYGSTKHRGDMAIEASGCRHLIFRVSWVYARGHANFARSMLRLARQKSSLDVVGDQVGSPTSAAFIASITGAAIGRIAAGGAEPLSGTYHLAPDGVVSRCDYARFLITEAKALGMDLTLAPEAIRPIATADFPLPAARPLNSRLDTGKLRSAFGLDLPDWRTEARRWVAESVAEGEM